MAFWVHVLCIVGHCNWQSFIVGRKNWRFLLNEWKKFASWYHFTNYILGIYFIRSILNCTSFTITGISDGIHLYHKIWGILPLKLHTVKICSAYICHTRNIWKPHIGVMDKPRAPKIYTWLCFRQLYCKLLTVQLMYLPTFLMVASWLPTASSAALTEIDIIVLQWRHNERDGVSNPQPHDCLLNRLFRRRS